MSTENSLIDAALRGWKSNVERADKLFGALSPAIILIATYTQVLGLENVP